MIFALQKRSSYYVTSMDRNCGFCNRTPQFIRFYATDPKSAEQDAAAEAAKVQYTENLKRNTRIAFWVIGGTGVATLIGSIVAYGKPRIDPDGNVVSCILVELCEFGNSGCVFFQIRDEFTDSKYLIFLDFGRFPFLQPFAFLVPIWKQYPLRTINEYKLWYYVSCSFFWVFLRVGLLGNESYIGILSEGPWGYSWYG